MTRAPKWKPMAVPRHGAVASWFARSAGYTLEVDQLSLGWFRCSAHRFTREGTADAPQFERCVTLAGAQQQCEDAVRERAKSA